MKIEKEEGIASCFMKVSQIGYQIQELREIIFDKEMATVVLNALLEEWGNFVSSIYGNKEATPFNELWSLFKIEETRLKVKVTWDQMNRIKHLLPWIREKESLVLGRRRSICQRSNAMAVRNMGTTRNIVFNSRSTTRKGNKELKPISLKK